MRTHTPSGCANTCKDLDEEFSNPPVTLRASPLLFFRKFGSEETPQGVRYLARYIHTHTHGNRQISCWAGFTAQVITSHQVQPWHALPLIVGLLVHPTFNQLSSPAMACLTNVLRFLRHATSNYTNHHFCADMKVGSNRKRQESSNPFYDHTPLAKT